MVFCLPNMWKFFTNWLRARRQRKLERKHTAYHEAGNAVVAHFLGLRVEQICITNSRQSFTTSHLQQQESNESMILKEITVMIAGRAAEDIKFGESQRGKEKLFKAFEKARFFVTYCDVSKLIGREETEHNRKSVSEKTNIIMSKAIILAREVLSKHTAEVERLALVLQFEDQLYESRIKAILNGNKY